MTKRLILKPVVPSFEFAQSLYEEISNNREFFKFMPFALIKKPEEEYNFLLSAKQNAEIGNAISYGMWLKDTKEFVGIVSAHNISWNRECGELGAWICKKFARNGFASEGLKALEICFFEMGFHKLCAKANVKNKSSCRTIEKLGFKKEGIERDFIYNEQIQEWENFAAFSKLYND